MKIDFFVRAIKKIIREIVYFVTKCRNNRILLIHESYSGSNTYALKKLVTEKFNKKYEIISYNDHEPSTLTGYLKKHALLASAKLIITTHASYKPSKKKYTFTVMAWAFYKEKWCNASRQQ